MLAYRVISHDVLDDKRVALTATFDGIEDPNAKDFVIIEGKIAKWNDIDWEIGYIDDIELYHHELVGPHGFQRLVGICVEGFEIGLSKI